MKKLLMSFALAVTCTASYAESAPATATASVPSTAVKTELMGYDTESYAGQEIRVAVTRETEAGRAAFCRQYVQSYTHEIAPSEGTDGFETVPVDKTTIVLGNRCKWN